MKKIILALLLAAVIFLLAGCATQSGEKRVTSAIIRYFDGTGEQVRITNYYCGTGTVKLWTEHGRVITVGINNVMIIEESEDQYNCKE